LFLYETHMHTSEGSACAHLSAKEQVRMYKELGYDGIFVTDHFFGGNTAVSRNLPWKERIERYCLGYEHAKEEGDRVGLQVFFGIETGFCGTEFLVYGVDKEWLISHPDMMEWSIKKQYEMIHRAGGLVVHAHPFRGHDKGKAAKLYPDAVDAVEVYNLGNIWRGVWMNESALSYAKEQNLPITGGGDAHNAGSLHGGILTEERICSVEEFIRMILKKTGYDVIKDSIKEKV